MEESNLSKRRISRRRFLASAAAAGAIAATPSWMRTARGSNAAATRRPNLILILTDDQRADSLSCAGNTVLRTPNIDALASRGVRFSNSFATTAICMSSRASILTGLYSRSHGINDFNTPLAQNLFQNSYPILLRNAGYRTGFVGKWGLGGPLPTKDYDYFAGYSGQGKYFEPGYPKHLTVRQGEQAIDFIRSSSTHQPFCLAVSFKAPHVQDEGRNQPGIYAKYPYDPALKNLYANANVPRPSATDANPLPEFLNHTLNRTREGPDFSPENYQETMKCLYRLISGADIAVGQIVTALRKQGLDDNTVIIFSSDHGSFYGEHGFGGKWLMYEPAIRTPLVVFDPRLHANQRNIVRNEIVLNIDIPATLLDLAGVTAPAQMQGQSVLPLIAGDYADWRDEWFYEHSFHGSMVNGQPAIAASEGIRTEKWKYIRYVDRTPVYEQLYDLQADQHEHSDVAGDTRYSGVLAQMRGKHANWTADLKRWQTDQQWNEPWMLRRMTHRHHA